MSPSSTSSSDFGRAGRFALRFVLFLVPVLLASAPFEILFWRTGECVPIARIADNTMKDDGFVYLRRYFSEQFFLYKKEMIHRKKPALLVLGSSRTFQLRPFMFHPAEADFYSGSGMIESLDALETVLSWYRKGGLGTPKVLILGLDPWWLRHEIPGTGQESKTRWSKDEAYLPNAHLVAIRNLFAGHFPLKYLNPALPIPPLADGYRPVGMGAIEFGTGFRSDGTVYHGLMYANEYRKDPTYRDRGDIINRVRNGTDQFALDGFDSVREERLMNVLASFKSMGTEIHVFLPPFSAECLGEFNRPRYTGWWARYLDCAAKIRKSGSQVVDATSTSHYGLTDEYMLDGFHPSDVFISYVVEEMIRTSPTGSILSKCDADYFKTMRSRPGVLPVAFPEH